LAPRFILFAATTLRIAVYLGWAAALFDFPPPRCKLAGSLSPCCLPRLLAFFRTWRGFPLRIFCFFKRGNPAKWFILGVYRVSRVACSFR